jgi:hypothetical protein
MVNMSIVNGHLTNKLSYFLRLPMTGCQGEVET